MKRMPLIGVPTLPFQGSWAEEPLEVLSAERVEYFWLLSRLTEKIISSIRAAGGVPVALTATDGAEEIGQIAARLDGFVFAGGHDIAPEFYGEENKGSGEADLARDRFELALCRAVFECGKPLLGICRGCQLLNVALGGTLTQDLPSINEKWALHRRPEVTRGYVHDVKILKPALFPSHAGETMRVNSMHHQAIARLSPQLEAAAVTEDGIIEAAFAPSAPWAVGVQWHPECLAQDDPVQMEIFRALVEKSGTARA